jgi:alpha-1,3-mannosyltransferase
MMSRFVWKIFWNFIHQRQYEDADMVCAMDWTYVGRDPTFYDVWVARDMNGDSFFEIPEDGSWELCMEPFLE